MNATAILQPGADSRSLRSLDDPDERRRVLSALLWRYHSKAAAGRRMRSTLFERTYGPVESIGADLDLLRGCRAALEASDAPRVSIVLPVYNEEVEIIPTLVSLLWSLHETALRAEIIAVDNLCTDRSRQLLTGAGVRVVDCPRPGLRFARAAGLAATHPGSDYVWLIDADTRTLPPLRRAADLSRAADPLGVSFEYMERHADCLATSTGIVFERQTVVRRLLRRVRLAWQGGLPYSCWTGPNQFIRKSSLLAVGGIDLEVDGGEDHHRIFQLMRYAKQHGGFVRGADREFSLFCPVYTSDRRNATIGGLVRNVLQQRRRPDYSRDQYDLPVHPQGVRYKDLFRRERGSARRAP